MDDQQFRQQLQIFAIDRVYEQLDRPQVRELFSQLLLLRKRGYSSRHEPGILPVDTYDFIATHYLVGLNQGNHRQLLAGIRHTTLTQANDYQLPFPMISMLQAAGAGQQLNHLKQMMLESPHKEFIYVSAWTFDPASRTDPVLTKALHDLISTISVYSQTDPAREVKLACGIPRLKTDQYIMQTGFTRMADENGPLPEVRQKNLQGEPVVLLQLPAGHEFAYRVQAKKYLDLWKSRTDLTLKTELKPVKKKKAA